MRRLRLRRRRRRRLLPPPESLLLLSLALAWAGAICVKLAICRYLLVSLYSVNLTNPMMPLADWAAIRAG